MAIKFKKTYTFALKSAGYITLFSTGFLALLLVVFHEFSWIICLIFSVTIAIFSFFVIQYRAERFIYRRIQKIYDDVTLLESTNLRNQAITTDMATLTREIKKFATDKKHEIEGLRVREEYRREFMGNVSHELKTPIAAIISASDNLMSPEASVNRQTRKSWPSIFQWPLSGLISRWKIC